jgi:hypothetical protein
MEGFMPGEKELKITSKGMRSKLTATSESYVAGEDKKMTLRLPPLLHSALSKIARDDRRSLHSEIIVILEEAARARGEYDGEGDKSDA